MPEDLKITINQLSIHTGFSTRKISRIIKVLRDKNKLCQIGSTIKGYWKVNR